jgi:TolB-like protein/class 3 adenylate cyclase
MASTRRLAAILAADVAGYSRLMGVDEEGTHERLKAHFRQLIDPKIDEHRGRIVKNTGDGVLAEFPSVVDAVRCAAEVQRGMIDREPMVSDERRIRFRIGVNLGDVIAEDGDIFGDGVNVAARLEALAEPGGICVSGTVRDQVRDKLPYALDDMGEQSVKNIARPVRVYALRPEAVAGLPARSVQLEASPRRLTTLVGLAAATAAALVIAVIAWWLWPGARSSPTATVAGATATSIPQPLVTPRLSIVVLPFANLSDDREQQYFADGVTEDLTTDLSRIAGSFVISRNTAFTYKDKLVNAKHIGRELGVRYVLEGSVRRSGNQVRVNAQLIDAETDAHLWAGRFERDTGDLFAVQNEITSRIAVALNLALIGAEAARPTANPDALDYILRGRAASAKPPSREKHAEAIDLFERALALDPNSVEAQSFLAGALAGRVLDYMTDSHAADIARAEGLVRQALAASPGSPLAHMAKGMILRAQSRYEEGILEFETVLSFNRNAIGALFQLGWCKLMTGSIEEVIPLAQQGIRLSPRDPIIGNFYSRIGLVHLLQSRTDEAIVWLEKARNANAVLFFVHAYLASAYALKDETNRAVAELAEARRLSSEGSFSSIARLSRGYYGVPKIRALYEATYFTGLRKAGVPEE